MSTQRRENREDLDLTQVEAAQRAGVSLATWRRWEENPESVSTATATKCNRVLERPATVSASVSQVDEAWETSTFLTARQAMALIITLNFWGDAYIGEWLRHPDEPLHEVPPFTHFDARVMMLVNENRAWAAKARERCHAVAEEIEGGRVPFGREGCYFDEVLMGAALLEAPDVLSDELGPFEDVPARLSPNGAADAPDRYNLSDEDWDVVADNFDDAAQWDDWEVPVMNDHPLLSFILAERHPFTWFDPVGPRPFMTETAARATQAIAREVPMALPRASPAKDLRKKRSQKQALSWPSSRKLGNS